MLNDFRQFALRGNVVDLAKRQAFECSFVEATCTATPSCGLIPLYNFLPDATPEFGKGVFPWQVHS